MYSTWRAVSGKYSCTNNLDSAIPIDSPVHVKSVRTCTHLCMLGSSSKRALFWCVDFAKEPYFFVSISQKSPRTFLRSLLVDDILKEPAHGCNPIRSK